MLRALLDDTDIAKLVGGGTEDINGDWGQVVAEMESRRPCDTDDRRGPSSDRVDVVPTLPLGMTNLARGPSWVGGRHFVPRGLV